MQLDGRDGVTACSGIFLAFRRGRKILASFKMSKCVIKNLLLFNIQLNNYVCSKVSKMGFINHWPHNRLKWDRGSKTLVVHTQQKVTQVLSGVNVCT